MWERMLTATRVLGSIFATSVVALCAVPSDGSAQSMELWLPPNAEVGQTIYATACPDASGSYVIFAENHESSEAETVFSGPTSGCILIPYQLRHEGQFRLLARSTDTSAPTESSDWIPVVAGANPPPETPQLTDFFILEDEVSPASGATVRICGDQSSFTMTLYAIYLDDPKSVRILPLVIPGCIDLTLPVEALGDRIRFRARSGSEWLGFTNSVPIETPGVQVSDFRLWTQPVKPDRWILSSFCVDVPGRFTLSTFGTNAETGHVIPSALMNQEFHVFSPGCQERLTVIHEPVGEAHTALRHCDLFEPGRCEWVGSTDWVPGVPRDASPGKTVVPGFNTASEGNERSSKPFSCADLPGSPDAMRYQQVYDGLQVGSGEIVELRFRHDASESDSPGPVELSNLSIQMSSTTSHPESLSDDFAANTTGPTTQVYAGTWVLDESDAPLSTPRAFDIAIPLNPPFVFDGSVGNLLVDISVDCASTGLLDATTQDPTLPPDGTSIAFTDTLGVQVQQDGLVTQFVFAERCGNGFLDAGEECDDGNRSNFDLCSPDCRIKVPVLASSEFRCVNSIYKGVQSTLARVVVEVQRCLSDVISGRTTRTADECLVADVRHKVQGQIDRTIRREEQRCEEAPPLGLTTAAAGTGAAVVNNAGLLEDIWGPDLDEGLARSQDSLRTAACQLRMMKQLGKCSRRIVREFSACALRDLRFGSAQTAEDLMLCLDHDPKGKIAKECGGNRIPRAVEACEGTTLAEAFPGCSQATSGAVAQCLDRQARCRACLTLRSMTGAAIDCDCP